MLTPQDFAVDETAVFNPLTRRIMDLIEFKHGGPEYDAKYPEGIPTSVQILFGDTLFDSGLVMFPAGHSRNTTANLGDILEHKFQVLGSLALPDGGDVAGLVGRLNGLPGLGSFDLGTLFDVELAQRASID